MSLLGKAKNQSSTWQKIKQLGMNKTDFVFLCFVGEEVDWISMFINFFFLKDGRSINKIIRAQYLYAIILIASIRAENEEEEDEILNSQATVDPRERERSIDGAEAENDRLRCSFESASRM